jgi:hypothetical protein
VAMVAGVDSAVSAEAHLVAAAPAEAGEEVQ